MRWWCIVRAIPQMRLALPPMTAEMMDLGSTASLAVSLEVVKNWASDVANLIDHLVLGPRIKERDDARGNLLHRALHH